MTSARIGGHAGNRKGAKAATRKQKLAEREAQRSARKCGRQIDLPAAQALVFRLWSGEERFLYWTSCCAAMLPQLITHVRDHGGELVAWPAGDGDRDRHGHEMLCLCTHHPCPDPRCDCSPPHDRPQAALGDLTIHLRRHGSQDVVVTAGWRRTGTAWADRVVWHDGDDGDDGAAREE
ncbi:MAG: hypothetical protein L0Z62_24515 [Gemmataceae bacterium]|nr:hypothetical protein [Gemmataceae bacterium]